jgi:hypothetical protein
MGEHAVYNWRDLEKTIEEVISTKFHPKKFSGVPYYLTTYYLGESRANAVAQFIRDRGYLARVDHPVERSGNYYIYVRRK